MNFIKKLFLTILGFMLLNSSIKAEEAAPRWNILFIFADDYGLC